MKKLFLTRELPELVMNKLEENFDLSYNDKDRVLTKDEIIENIRKNDILLCLLTDKIDKDVIDANPNLMGISNYAVGYNNIDVEYAVKKGIPVTNTPGVLTETTAELAIGLFFSAARRIVEADAWIRKGNYKGWSPTLFLGTDLHQKELGIIGGGRIGAATAKKAQALGMNVHYYDIEDKEEFEKLNIERVELKKILINSDFISLHVPLNDSTQHLIDEKELNLVKKTAFIINTSRGPVINEKALYKSLSENKIGGAALDVFELEPKITSGLEKLDNVVLTPHIASASVKTRTQMGYLAVNNAIDIANNKKPKHIVNPQIY